MSAAVSGATASGPVCRRAEDERSSSGVVRGAGSACRPETHPVHRRNRLSRSKDFDAVYRRGRSASSRYLVLHWFAREDGGEGEPRLGLAVPRSVGSAVARNRVKRLLRESWRELLPTVPAGQDYVLAARPGLAEPAETRGKDWLVTEIAEILEKARAA
jgi:ribonuclease P protein component